MSLLDRLMKKITNAAEKGVEQALSQKISDAVNSAISSAVGGTNTKEPEETADEAAFRKDREAFEEKLKQDILANAQHSLDQANAALNNIENAMTYNRTPLQLLVKHDEPVPLAYGARTSDISDHGSTAYFADLIEKNLPDLTVHTSVSIREALGSAPEKNTDISVLIFRGLTPVLAIFLVPKTAYKRRAVIESMNACERAGIPAIRFMKEFRNDADYVIGRINTVAK